MMTQGAMIWEESGRWYGAIASDEGIVVLIWSSDRDKVVNDLPDITDIEVGAAARRNLERLRRELHEYHTGKRTKFTVLAAPKGTEFQKKVWDALIGVPYGKSMSYGDLAKQIGNPAASRAVGQAVRNNPVPIIIPCHRILASHGKIGGFGGSTEEDSLEEKRRLLRHEGIEWKE